MRPRTVAAGVLLAVLCAGCQGTQAPIDTTGSAATSASTQAANTSTPPADGSAQTAVETSVRAVPLPEVEQLEAQRFDLRSERVVAPAALIEADGSLWVQDHRGSLLTRVQPDTGEILAQIDTARKGCGDLAAAAAAVWWTGCGVTPGLVKVDVRTHGVLEEYDGLGLGPAVLSDEIWLPVQSGLQATNASLSRIPLDGSAEPTLVPVPGLLSGDAGAVVAGGSVWVTDKYGGVVYQVDPETEQVLAAVPVPLGKGVGYLIEHDGAPWYYDSWLGRLVGIDPATLQVRLLDVVLEPPTQYWGVAASSAPEAPGQLWARSGDGEAWLIDTRSDEVLRRVAVDPAGAGGDIQQIGDALWVSGFASGTIERIELPDEG